VIAPTHVSDDRLVAERDGYRMSLQHLVQRRQTLSDTELSKLDALGVSFDRSTKQIHWTPVNGNGADVSTEAKAYEKSLLALMEREEFSFTEEELAEMEASGATFEAVLADINERLNARRLERAGQ
jgi:hypothetical protein